MNAPTTIKGTRPVDRDTWATPPFIVHWTARRWGSITMDLAADIDNTVADFWMGIGSNYPDALEEDWAAIARDLTIAREWPQHAWINPPYSAIDPWIEKAVAAKAGGLSVTMLIPAMPGEARFRMISQHATEIVFILGRLAFLDANDRPVSGNTTGSCLVHFRAFDTGAPRVLWVGRDAMREEAQ